jgi:hypothetical protein
MTNSTSKETKPTSSLELPGDRPRIELSVPWGDPIQVGPSGNGSEDLFVKERTRLHELYILQESTNKRIGLILAFLLILVAVLVVVFAPTGRETISYWVGAALIIFAAGAIGFGRVWAKASKISVGADGVKGRL